jgi:hypothetical protein
MLSAHQESSFGLLAVPHGFRSVGILPIYVSRRVGTTSTGQVAPRNTPSLTLPTKS